VLHRLGGNVQLFHNIISPGQFHPTCNRHYLD
jgi:hypothetical protein